MAVTVPLSMRFISGARDPTPSLTNFVWEGKTIQIEVRTIYLNDNSMRSFMCRENDGTIAIWKRMM